MPDLTVTLAAIPPHATALERAIHRHGSNSGRCKVWSGAMVVGMLLFSAGRAQMAALPWAAGVVVLLALADAGQVALARSFTVAYNRFMAKVPLNGGNVPKAEDWLVLPEADLRLRDAGRVFGALGSFSVWPFYAALLGLVVAAHVQMSGSDGCCGDGKSARLLPSSATGRSSATRGCAAGGGCGAESGKGCGCGSAAESKAAKVSPARPAPVVVKSASSILSSPPRTPPAMTGTPVPAGPFQTLPQPARTVPTPARPPVNLPQNFPTGAGAVAPQNAKPLPLAGRAATAIPGVQSPNIGAPRPGQQPVPAADALKPPAPASAPPAAPSQPETPATDPSPGAAQPPTSPPPGGGNPAQK